MKSHRLLWITIAALVVVVIIALLFLHCGGFGDAEPDDSLGNDIIFVRKDLSVVQFSESAPIYIWYGDYNLGEASKPALHVWVGARSPTQPYWLLRVVTSRIELNVPLSLPRVFVKDVPKGIQLFLCDPPNELATTREGSSGTITFHKHPSSGLVDFSIDAVMGSEYFDLPTVTARGRFIGQITAPPFWWTEHQGI